VSRSFKIVLGTLLALFILVVLPGLAPWLMDVVFRLVFGCVNHAITVLPKVTVNGSGVGMFALCVAITAVIGHRFCGWLWTGTGHVDPWRPRWTVAGLGVIVLMFGAGMAFTAVAHQTGWILRAKEPLLTSGVSNDRNAAASLKSILSAQADFRSNDRDGNKENDFWRMDIAGLYAVKDPGGVPIKLIELSVACADGSPLTDLSTYGVKSAKAGYWFKALKFRGETTPDPNRFAVLAYPDSPSAGKHLFIACDDGILYRRPLDAGPIPEVFPDDPAKDGWWKLD
jgi:hypothetical protein